MKCPKCAYLGFDTGDRCKNCGYDFSLLSASTYPAADPEIPMSPVMTPSAPTPTDVWLRDASGASDTGLPEVDLDIPLAATHAVAAVAVMEPPPALAAAPAPAVGRVSPDPASLPLFMSGALSELGDDMPLITLPAKPRAPLSVRRTPEVPRLRVAARARVSEPALDFRDGLEDAVEAGSDPALTPLRPGSDPALTPAPAAEAVGTDRIAGRRLAAAAIDHGMLLVIDLAVLYFTLRMAGLGLSEVRLIPPVPFVLFLLLMKVAYFAAFTAVGGQTIGKMAAGIRVVTDDLRTVDPPGALRRTMAALLSPLTLGLAYLPALVGADRRAIHDRLARTRVVALPSA